MSKVFERLEMLAKGIGNTIVPFVPHTIRAHKRLHLRRKNAHRVAAHRRRKFKQVK